MFQILIFTCLWHFTITHQNCGDDLRHGVQFINIIEDKTLNRIPRAASRVPARVEKPVDCAKLHQTEETPFVAIILNRATGRLLCMGSIIDEKHILTAAKCVQSTHYKTLRILVGYFKAWWGRHSFVYFVEKVIKHESEIVILRLTLPIQFSRTIRPIRLLRFEDAPAPEQGGGGGGGGTKGTGGSGGSKPKPKPKPSRKENNPYSKDKSKNNSEKSITSIESSIPAEDSNEDTDTADKENSFDSDQISSEPNDDSFRSLPWPNNDFAEGMTRENGEETTIANKEKTEDENISNNDHEQNEIAERMGSDVIEEKENDEQNSRNYGDENEDDNSEEDNDENDDEEDEDFSYIKNLGAKEDGDYDKLVELYKRYQRQGKKDDEAPENKTFVELHTQIKSVLIVGFPVTDEDVVGDPIPQTLVYGMRPENTTEEPKPCLEAYKETPELTEEEDPYKDKRIICTDGTSKFCWGCLGGPTLFRREKEYIQVGVIIATKCENKQKPDPYMHARVDYHMKWISKNSYVHFRN